MKNICIPENLFYDLVLYHLCDMDGPSERIQKGLNDKMDAILRHEHYHYPFAGCYDDSNG